MAVGAINRIKKQGDEIWVIFFRLMMVGEDFSEELPLKLRAD